MISLGPRVVYGNNGKKYGKTEGHKRQMRNNWGEGSRDSDISVVVKNLTINCPSHRFNNAVVIKPHFNNQT